jgi:hypothetical protein
MDQEVKSSSNNNKLRLDLWLLLQLKDYKQMKQMKKKKEAAGGKCSKHELERMEKKSEVAHKKILKKIKSRKQ